MVLLFNSTCLSGQSYPAKKSVADCALLWKLNFILSITNMQTWDKWVTRKFAIFACELVHCGCLGVFFVWFFHRCPSGVVSLWSKSELKCTHWVVAFTILPSGWHIPHTHSHLHTYTQSIHTEETVNKTHALSFNEMICNRDQQHHAFSDKIWIAACIMWIVTPLF